jgi:hypothetical protein
VANGEDLEVTVELWDLGGGSAQRAPLYLRDLWAYVRAHDSVEKQVRANEHAISAH